MRTLHGRIPITIDGREVGTAIVATGIKPPGVALTEIHLDMDITDDEVAKLLGGSTAKATVPLCP